MTTLEQIKKEEVWEDVHGWEGYYLISNYGRIKAIRRQGSSGEIKEPRIGDTGYYQVWLSRPGFRKEYKVHRLVASVFVKNPELKPFVCHKDGDRLHNKAENLYYGNHSDNAKDREHHKREDLKEVIKRLDRIERKIDELPINELLDPNGSLLSTINDLSAQVYHLRK